MMPSALGVLYPIIINRDAGNQAFGLKDAWRKLSGGAYDNNSRPWFISLKKGETPDLISDLGRNLKLGGKGCPIHLVADAGSAIEAEYLLPFLANDVKRLGRLKEEYAQVQFHLLLTREAVSALAEIQCIGQWNNFYKQNEEYYLEAEVTDFIIRDKNDDPKELGILSGTICLLLKWDDTHGFEFMNISFSNHFLHNIVHDNGHGETLTLAGIQENMVEAFKMETSYSIALLNLEQRTLARLGLDDPRRTAANQLINRIMQMKAYCPQEERLLGEILYTTDRLLSLQVDFRKKKLYEAQYRSLSEKVKNHRGGAMIAVAMVGVVAASLVALCCLTGVGVITLPFLSWGLSYLIPCATISAVTSLASFSFFNRMLKREAVVAGMEKLIKPTSASI